MDKKYIELIRTVPDFPVKGINFFDWMPVMGCPDALSLLIDDMLELVKGGNFTKVAALESRGYLLGLPMAERLGIGFVPLGSKANCLANVFVRNICWNMEVMP